MSRPVFIDTAGFFAMLDTGDKNHQFADAFITKLRVNRHSAITTDHVISETYTLLKARKRRWHISGFHDIVSRSYSLKIIWTDQALFEKASKFLLQHSDKDYSFVDCLSFVVMKENKLTQALTTDEHFAQAGFKPLLAA